MGHNDIHNLMKIKEEIQKINRLYHQDYCFLLDHGDMANLIVIKEDGKWIRAMDNLNNWEDVKAFGTSYTPDLIDFKHKMIIEYDEEYKPGKKGGKLGKKGHNELSDSQGRNADYLKAGFRLFVIYEQDFGENMLIWRDTLKMALLTWSWKDSFRTTADLN